MKKWKGFIYIKLLAVLLFAVSIIIGTYRVVLLRDDGEAVGDVLSGKEAPVFEESSAYNAAISYYKEAFENYLEIRQLLNIDEKGELNYDQVIIYNCNGNTNKHHTLTDIMAEQGARGGIYANLLLAYEQLSEGNYLHDTTAKGCIKRWKKNSKHFVWIDEERYIFAGKSVDKTTKNTIDLEKAYTLVSDLMQCYDFYTELFELQPSNLSYKIFNYAHAATPKGYGEYTNYVNSNTGGRLTVYDLKEQNMESGIIGITSDDLRYYTKYLSDSSIQPNKNGLAVSAKMYDAENKIALAMRLDTAYNEQDVFRTLYQKYTKSYERAEKYVSEFIQCTICALITFLFLVYACGSTEIIEEDKKKRIRYVQRGTDKWFTEFIFFGFLGSVLLTLCMMKDWLFDKDMWLYVDGMWQQYYEDGTLCTVALSVMILITCLLFFCNIRKIKAGCFWKNTLTAKILFALKNQNSRLRKRMAERKEFFRNMGEDKRGVKKIVFFELTRLGCIGIIALLAVIVQDGFYGYMSFTEYLLVCIILLVIAAYLYLTFLFYKWIINSRAADRDIVQGVRIIADGNLDYKLSDENAIDIREELIAGINQIGEGLANAVADGVKSERMKTELITNVSHDIKTPLTSVINYVDLLKRENIEDEKIQGYIEVLDNKSQRLKVLIEDLIEASKASSGAIQLVIARLNFNELVNQTNGEFMERFADKNLTMVPAVTQEPLIIEGDGRRIYRILENLYQNVNKYAMEGTRVYVELRKEAAMAVFQIKNISKEPLTTCVEELTERFVRGEESRTTEGSGLGLSIAKSLTELQKGNFEIYLDGDLFRVTVEFPLCEA